MQLRDRQAALRHQQFVGRADEIAAVEAAVAAAGDGPQVFLIHAAGGCGKTSVLLELRARHPTATYLDAREVEPNVASARRAFGPATAKPPALVLLDSVEHLAPLDGWLRESFIPELPVGVVLVLAGRVTPSAAWHALPGWGSIIRPLPIGPLDERDARALLERRGVASARHGEVLTFSHGHPLALCMAADALAGDPGLSLAQGPAPDLVRALLAHVVARAPSDGHRAALEAAAKVRTLTQRLLAILLDETDVHEKFEWLAGLSFMTAGPSGLFPHDLVRELLDAELRWRDPEWNRLLLERAHREYFSKLAGAEGPEHQRSAVDWVFLNRHSPLFNSGFDVETAASQRVELARPSDEAAVRELVTRHEGAESADVIAHWLRRRPEMFYVFRDDRPGLAGLVLALWLEDLAPDDAAVDPGVVAALRVIARLGPLRPGERATMSRAWMARDGYQQQSPIQAWHIGLGSRIHAATRGLRYLFSVVADPDYWADSFSHAGAEHDPADDFVVGGKRYAPFLMDYRVVRPLDAMGAVLQHQGAPQRAVRRPTDVVRLDRAAFANEVRLALKNLHHPPALAESPLARSRLTWSGVALDAEPATRGRALAALLTDSVASIAANPRNQRAQRALHHTYIEPPVVQKQAAAGLGLTWSGYRKHLTAGIALVADLLWRREIEG